MVTTKISEIVCELRQRITDEIYPPGSLMPTIDELRVEFGAARGTVREAINRLALEGLVEPTRGKPAKVRDTSPVTLSYRGTLQTWQDQTGGDAEIAEAGWEDADPEVAERLGVAVGDPVVHRLVYFRKNGTIAIIRDEWYPQHLVDTIVKRGLVDPDLSNTHGMYSKMVSCGYVGARSLEDIYTRPAQVIERQTMQMPPAYSVLVTIGTVVDEHRTPLYCFEAVAAGDRNIIRMDLPLKD